MDQLDTFVLAAGPFLLPLLFLATLIEYVFPPFPGDLVTAIGTMLAVRGEVPVWAAFLVCTLGSIAGTYIDYRFGVWLQHRIEDPRHVRMRKIFHPELLVKLEKQYQRWGPWLIVANRFVPVSRAVFIVFAGMSGIPVRRTMVLGTISAMAWNALLIAVGYSVGANLDALQAFLTRYSRIALTVFLVLAVLGGIVYLWRRRGARVPGKEGDSAS